MIFFFFFFAIVYLAEQYFNIPNVKENAFYIPLAVPLETLEIWTWE